MSMIPSFVTAMFILARVGTSLSKLSRSFNNKPWFACPGRQPAIAIATIVTVDLPSNVRVPPYDSEINSFPSPLYPSNLLQPQMVTSSQRKILICNITVIHLVLLRNLSWCNIEKMSSFYSFAIILKLSGTWCFIKMSMESEMILLYLFELQYICFFFI